MESAVGMSSSREQLEARANEFCRRYGLTLSHGLGFGIDGSVYSTVQESAVKVHERHFTYFTEIEVYQRLAEWKVKSICGHTVPRMMRHDDELWTLEISIVRPPFLLDFAKASLDFPPDFTDEVMQEWHERCAEMFGERWPAVRTIMSELEERYGIYLLDVNPGNIKFA